MKALSKIVTFAGSTSLVIATFAVFAVSPTYAVDGATACTQIAADSTTSAKTIITHLATMDKDFTTRLSNISSRDDTVDTNVTAARTKAAAAFDAKITAMNTQDGVTTAQKAAIKAYSDAMHTAEKTRETAVDAARQDYRANLIADVKLHQTNLTNAATTYQGAVAAAFTTAASTCGASGITSIETLKTDVKTARAAFKTARDDAKITTDIKALMATRNAAIKAADSDFAKTAATLSATLTTAMNATTSTSNS